MYSIFNPQGSPPPTARRIAAFPRESIQINARASAAPSSPTATVPDHWAVHPTPIRVAGSIPGAAITRRVALQTDVRNMRSRAAIERIGGRLDGIMRADRPGADDTVRTSARFSIVASEWPEVKARLAARLAAGTKGPLSPS